MKTGYSGTFVISWTQTEVDGISAGSQRALSVGASWAWRGDAICVDGPSDRLRLDAASGSERTRQRAARMVQKLVGAAVTDTPASDLDLLEDDFEASPFRDNTIVVSDGAQSYTGTMIDVRPDTPPLIMFLDQLPPKNRDLWVVHATTTAPPTPVDPQEQGAVICFTPGTRLLTADGDVAIEDLHEGSLIQTKDNGLQPIEWIGGRKMTGARLFAMPWLRPVRMAAHALGGSKPDEQLLVSPMHRIILSGQIARDLFNEDEVLVTAKDLINGKTVTMDHQMREVTYIHVLLPRHEVIWANGLATESYHPASAPLSALSKVDRETLLARYPDLGVDAHRYGGYARRNLTTSEAAILQHAA